MTKAQAITLITDLLRDRDSHPFWTDEQKEGYRHACGDIVRSLDSAGGFEREMLPTRAELIDVADHPRTHDDDIRYLRRAIDALIAAGFLKVRP